MGEEKKKKPKKLPQTWTLIDVFFEMSATCLEFACPLCKRTFTCQAEEYKKYYFCPWCKTKLGLTEDEEGLFADAEENRFKYEMRYEELKWE